ncbi:MAG TPA: YdcF family protein [Thermodesulfobacteriota bacterium]|nr:YdcF family protein [Thermodesulfobacteriota bacterium]
MTFVAGKLLALVADPGNALLLLLAVGTVLLWTRWPGPGRLLVTLATAAGFLTALLPVGALLLAPLENRFPPAPLPARVDGIIVLGGSVDQLVAAARGRTALNDSAERLTSFVALARRYPTARLVVSGGSGRLVRPQVKEGVAVRLLFEELGVDQTRILFEERSRTTYENVRYARELVKPRPGETWVLVTSAAHMPRAVGCFRRAGWPVVPYPVDYRTGGPVSSVSIALTPFGDRLDALRYALHEWAGLVAYRLTGRTDRLFPGP